MSSANAVINQLWRNRFQSGNTQKSLKSLGLGIHCGSLLLSTALSWFWCWLRPELEVRYIWPQRKTTTFATAIIMVVKTVRSHIHIMTQEFSKLTPYICVTRNKVTSYHNIWSIPNQNPNLQIIHLKPNHPTSSIMPNAQASWFTCQSSKVKICTKTTF